VSATAAKDPTADVSLAQTICLLALSRGEQPPRLPITTRRSLLRARWIAPAAELAAFGRRTYAITEDGAAALASSPFAAEAARKIEMAMKRRMW
jgi:hypothetical protein